MVENMSLNGKLAFSSLLMAVLFTSFFSVSKRGSSDGFVLGESVSITDIRGGFADIPIKKPKKIKDIDISKIKAQSVLAYDKATGEIIAEKQPNQQLRIASLTKLMTALLALEYLDLDKAYDITQDSQIKVTPIASLKSGTQVLGKDLLVSMLVSSANDSALAIAHSIKETTGTDIVELMNKKAKELGMHGTKFSNPLGFDEGINISTAYDMQLLARACLHHGIFEVIGKTKNFSFQDSLGYKHSVKTTNKLIAAHKDIEAIKTGFTPEAAGAMVTQVDVNGNKIVLIILGSSDREDDTLRLKDELSKSYVWVVQ